MYGTNYRGIWNGNGYVAFRCERNGLFCTSYVRTGGGVNVQQIIREYGGALLGATGATLVLGILGTLLLSNEGCLANMILLWLDGGI